MIRSSITWLLICCGSVSVSFGQQKNAKPVVLFTVDKKPVLAEEFIYLYKKNHQDKPEEFTKEKIDEYLDLFINFKLKVAEARYRGMDTTAAFRKEYNTYREELRKPYLPDSKLVDSLVALTYERLKEEVRASHILINIPPNATPADTLVAWQKINALRTRAINGEDFSSLALANSEDPTAKYNKGDLGYFTAMQMVFPFENVVYKTKPGEISAPLRTKFGYHILKVTDRRPSRGEVEVSHIMIRPGNDPERAKNLIFDIYDQLQKGVKWEELVTEYSEDAATKDKGGRLRPFGVGVMANVPPFEPVAFSLSKPGDFSDPFQSQYGWHILRLERKIPVPSFETISASLKNRVSRDERTQISREAVQMKMKKEFGFKENGEVKEKVLALADSSLHAAKWRKTVDQTTGNASLFTMQGKNYTVNDFLQFVYKNQKTNILNPSQYLAQLYTSYTDEMFGLVLEQKIARDHPDYNWLLREYYEGIMLFEIMEKEVWNKASEDSLGQVKYYQENLSKYQAGERMEGRIFSSSSKPALEQLKALLEKADSTEIDKLISAQKIRHESGVYQKTDRPVLSRISWQPGIYVAESNNVNYVVWVQKMVPAGQMSFTEARSSIVSDYQTFLEKKWIGQLKKKYPVKVNKKGQQHVIQVLTK